MLVMPESESRLGGCQKANRVRGLATQGRDAFLTGGPESWWPASRDTKNGPELLGACNSGALHTSWKIKGLVIGDGECQVATRTHGRLQPKGGAQSSQKDWNAGGRHRRCRMQRELAGACDAREDAVLTG